MNLRSIAVASVAALTLGCAPDDDAKLQQLANKCKAASEHIHEANTADRLEVFGQPYGGRKVGRAQAKAISCCAESLIGRLLKAPNPFAAVRYTFDGPDPEGDPPAACLGKFSILVTDPKEIKVRCGTKYSPHPIDDPSIAYFAAMEVGIPDEYDVRPTEFKVWNRAGQTIASQQSYELLLGGMDSDGDFKFKRFCCYGDAQLTKTCDLTPIDTFLKQVLRGAPRTAPSAQSPQSSNYVFQPTGLASLRSAAAGG